MAFKISSVDIILEQFLKTLKRFPVSITVATLGTILLIIAIDMDDWDVQQRYMMGAFNCIIALAALIGVKTFAEARKLSIGATYGLKALVIALVLLFFFRVDDFESYYYPMYFSLLVLAAHLFVAFSPWLGGEGRKGFWQYNKQLFLKILTAVIYSGVLFAGLALAILAVDQLFNADIQEETYIRLFFVIAGIFNTVFFLSGVPTDYEALKQEESYPKALKVFTQYILLPLVFVYLVILYAYMAKILINTEWPVGWVAILVLCFSIAGIFSFLLIYPLRNKEDHKWIGVFTRWFYIALIPLTVMLYVAIFKRLAQYGFTEERYFVLLLALWLTGIIAYFLISKKDDIRIIPISLFLLTIFAVFTASSVAKMSQLKHLESLLESNDALSEGKINTENKDYSFDFEKRLSSAFDFFDDRQRIMAVQPYLNFSLDDLRSEITDGSMKNIHLANHIMKNLGLNYRSRWESAPVNGNDFVHYNFYSTVPQIFNVKGYDLMRRQYIPDQMASDNELNLSYNEEEGYRVNYKDLYLNIDLESFARNLAAKNPEGYSGLGEEMKLEFENEKIAVRIYLEDLNFSLDDDRVLDVGGNAWILIREN